MMKMQNSVRDAEKKFKIINNVSKEDIILSNIGAIKEFYDNSVEHEWERLERNPYEFRINTYFMDRYIKPGDKVLDVGGGPGRYSLYFANKGCDVTLVDLSKENVKFAKEKAKELNLKIKAIDGNACDIDNLVNEQYDHVLLMGPLYHLIEESDRRKAVSNCLKLLKPNGVFYASFISACAGIIYLLREDPSMIENSKLIEDYTYFEEDHAFSGNAFTEARFERIWDIVPFMNEYNLKKLHLLGSESILSPFKNQVLSQPQIIIDKCIDLAIKVCEREDLLSYSEHLLYIGKK